MDWACSPFLIHTSIHPSSQAPSLGCRRYQKHITSTYFEWDICICHQIGICICHQCFVLVFAQVKKLEDDCGERESGEEGEMQSSIENLGETKIRTTPASLRKCKYFPQNTTKKTICQILCSPKYCLSDEAKVLLGANI